MQWNIERLDGQGTNGCRRCHRTSSSLVQLQIADCRLLIAHAEAIGAATKPERLAWECPKSVWLDYTTELSVASCRWYRGKKTHLDLIATPGFMTKVVIARFHLLTFGYDQL